MRVLCVPASLNLINFTIVNKSRILKRKLTSLCRLFFFIDFIEIMTNRYFTSDILYICLRIIIFARCIFAFLNSIISNYR